MKKPKRYINSDFGNGEVLFAFYQTLKYIYNLK